MRSGLRSPGAHPSYGRGTLRKAPDAAARAAIALRRSDAIGVCRAGVDWPTIARKLAADFTANSTAPLTRRDTAPVLTDDREMRSHSA